jgi:hypothetical protein
LEIAPLASPRRCASRPLVGRTPGPRPTQASRVAGTTRPASRRSSRPRATGVTTAAGRKRARSSQPPSPDRRDCSVAEAVASRLPGGHQKAIVGEMHGSRSGRSAFVLGAEVMLVGRQRRSLRTPRSGCRGLPNTNAGRLGRALLLHPRRMSSRLKHAVMATFRDPGERVRVGRLARLPVETPPRPAPDSGVRRVLRSADRG